MTCVDVDDEDDDAEDGIEVLSSELLASGDPPCTCALQMPPDEDFRGVRGNLTSIPVVLVHGSVRRRVSRAGHRHPAQVFCGRSCQTYACRTAVHQKQTRGTRQKRLHQSTIETAFSPPGIQLLSASRCAVSCLTSWLMPITVVSNICSNHVFCCIVWRCVFDVRLGSVVKFVFEGARKYDVIVSMVLLK